ncbi:MAG: glycosyltransferase [Bacteroidia bacterium]|nr:glycosyltransferase [Bacteroidia bacterium]
MKVKQKILVVSAVNPFSYESGQALRVHYTLKALSENFHITLLLLDTKKEYINSSITKIEIVKLPSIYQSNKLIKYTLRFIGIFYTLITSLKFSNFIYNYIEFTPKRVLKYVKLLDYKIVLFEYWHMTSLAKKVKSLNIFSVVDTHNVLWQTYKINLESLFLPKFISNYYIEKYKKYEENYSLKYYDVIIAINFLEKQYFETIINSNQKVLFCPMGIAITEWPNLELSEKNEASVFFYGGLASKHNEIAAKFLIVDVFPLIIKELPFFKIYIIGSNPSTEIKKLGNDTNIIVTGFVDNPNLIFNKLGIAAIPWKGTYGFRSRIIEIMSSGNIVLTSKDALYGMDFEDGKNVIFIEGFEAKLWSDSIVKIFKNRIENKLIIKNAITRVNNIYSYDKSYKLLSENIYNTIGCNESK